MKDLVDDPNIDGFCPQTFTPAPNLEHWESSINDRKTTISTKAISQVKHPKDT